MNPATDPWTPLATGAYPAWALGDHGPLVLAVHGIEDGWRSWTPVARELARHCRVVAVDPPWRTGNDYRWRADRSPGDWLADAAAGLAEPVDVLLAHSFGANAALECLAAGFRPRSAVLIAPSYQPRGDVPDARLRVDSAAALDGTIREGLRARLGERRDRVDPEILGAMVAGLSERLMPLVFPVFYDCFVGSGRLDLAAVDTPALVLGGAADPALAGGRAAGLARDMPAAQVRLYADYGHFCHVEQPAALAAEIVQFLTACSMFESGHADALGGFIQ